MPQNYYSLSQITGHLQKLVRKTYTREYWIKAEVVKLNYYPKSGHCYPDLVEKDSSGVKAQLRAIIWKTTYQVLNERFMKEAGRPLADGMELLFKAKIDFSPAHGLSLIISDVDPAFTLGKMAVEKLQTIKKLKAEQLFFKNKSLPFPLFPKRIAVISVETSKGYHDFINILNNNSRGYRFFTRLFPAVLQGDAAIPSIKGQLERIARVARYFDVVAIIRGGGGDVGLDGYNDYSLARSIADFPLPVVSGIGHSTNETVAELVSHTNAITPTEVGYMLQQKFDNLSVRLDELKQRMLVLVLDGLAAEGQKLASMASSMRMIEQGYLRQRAQGLSHLENRLAKNTQAFLLSQRHLLSDKASRLRFIKHLSLNPAATRLINMQNVLSAVATAHLSGAAADLQHLSEKIDLLNPLQVLKMGYSITRFKGKVLSQSAHLKEGDRIETQTYKGLVESKVIKCK